MQRGRAVSPWSQVRPTTESAAARFEAEPSTLEVVGFLVQRGDQPIDAAATQDRCELRPPRRQLAEHVMMDTGPPFDLMIWVLTRVPCFICCSPSTWNCSPAYSSNRVA